MNAVLHRIWLWFWHLLPANPILVRVVFGASRRVRHLWLRTGYLSGLLAVILFSLMPFTGQRQSSLNELAKGASQTFAWASIMQLGMICLIAPVFTAAAINQERDAQTFNILLSTPLSNAQIVFGSLLSRLYFVIVLLLAGLPFFFATMVYGGVGVSQVLESFALSASTAMLTGAVAILIAMTGVGSRRTIFSFYLTIAVYLIAVYLTAVFWKGTWVAAAPPNNAGTQMSWLAPLHPFLALDVSLNRVQPPPFGHLGGYSELVRSALAYPATAYVTWTTLTALLLTLLSILLVRRGAKLGEPTVFSGIWRWFRRFGRNRGTRPPRTVWANPVAWREAKTRSASGGMLRWLLILGGLSVAVLVGMDYIDKGLTAEQVRVWLKVVILIQFGVALIVASNTASSAISKERESRSLDILLTTPVTSRYFLWGKLRGLVSYALPLVLSPTVILLGFALYGWKRGDKPPAVWLEAPLQLALLMIGYTALACVIGLRISLVSRKNVVAMMYSIGALVALCGTLSLIGFPLVGEAGGDFGAFVAPFTPITSVWFVVDPRDLFDTVKEFEAGASGARLASLLGCLIATVLYLVIVWTVYTGLVRNFDMIVRRQSGT